MQEFATTQGTVATFLHHLQMNLAGAQTLATRNYSSALTLFSPAVAPWKVHGAPHPERGLQDRREPRDSGAIPQVPGPW